MYYGMLIMPFCLQGNVMNIFRLPLLNWFVVNGVAAYFLFIQDNLYWHFSGWMGIFGILVMLESVGWIVAGMYYFHRHKTSPNPTAKASYLITSGPYRFSRNPLYLAFTSMCLALSLFAHSPYFLISGLVFWLITDLYTIPYEEKFLSERFSQEWQHYSQQTRRWL